jgi:hypothetical protein
MKPIKLALGVCIAMLVAAGLGYYYGKGQKEVITQKVKGEERVVYKDKIVTVTKVVKPDGTVTEEIKTEDRSGSKDSRTSSTDTQVRSKQSQYKLGLSYSVDYEKPALQDPMSLHVQAGTRLFGPIWMDAQVGMRNSLIGLSLEF